MKKIKYKGKIYCEASNQAEVGKIEQELQKAGLEKAPSELAKKYQDVEAYTNMAPAKVQKAFVNHNMFKIFDGAFEIADLIKYARKNDVLYWIAFEGGKYVLFSGRDQNKIKKNLEMLEEKVGNSLTDWVGTW